MAEPVSRSIGSGFASPAYPIIANNPAFKVEIIPLSNRFEQENKAKPNTQEIGEIKVGQMIRGEVLGGTDQKTEQVEGRVVAVDQEDETVLSFRVITKDGDEVNVDPTTASKIDGHPEDFAEETQPGDTYENDIMTYEQWLAESRE
jgi:hypothetical protein